MAMIWSRAQNFNSVARRVALASPYISGKRTASGSSSSTPPTSGEIKYPFKVVPMEVKPPEDYKNLLPDPIEHATGLEKKQLLAQLQGDDRYEAKVYHIRGGTKDDPMIVPSHLEARLIGCVCEPDQHFVVYTWLRKDMDKRCRCGYWFKLVDAEPDLF